MIAARARRGGAASRCAGLPTRCRRRWLKGTRRRSGRRHSGDGRHAMSPRVAFRYSLRELRGSLGRVWVWVGVPLGRRRRRRFGGGTRLERRRRDSGRGQEAAGGGPGVPLAGPIPATAIEAIDAAPGAVRADVREMAAMAGRAAPREAGAGPSSLLVELKAVAGGYPFYGEVVAAPPLPAGASVAEALGDRSALVSPEALSGSAWRSATSFVSAGGRSGSPARWKTSRTGCRPASPSARGSSSAWRGRRRRDLPVRRLRRLPGAGAAAGGEFARGTGVAGRAVSGRDRRRCGGPGSRPGPMPSPAFARTSNAFRATWGWSRCCRSSSAASAWPRAFAPG